MVLLLVTQALGWSHRGHVWADDELPLRVCAAAPLAETTDAAIGLWNRDTSAPWLTSSCDAPHIRVDFDDDAPGAIAAFALQPSETRNERTQCSYTRVLSGRADVWFSGDVDWTAPVGTAAGSCAPEDLQVRLLARYLGVTLGLDSAPDSDVMGPFENCAPPVVTPIDQDGLLALYGFPGACSPEDARSFEEDDVQPSVDASSAGCSLVSRMSVAGWWMAALVVFARRRVQNKPS